MKAPRLFFGFSVFALALMALNQAYANVSLKNGNFFLAYTDLVYSGGFEPKLERVYNSKSSYKGMFGWGWGNEFEAHLRVSADGSVVMYEYGGGAENRFNPMAFNAAELNKSVEELTQIAQRNGSFGNTAQLASYKGRLKTDATFRNQQWELFRSQGKMQARQLALGTQLQSNRFSYQYLTKVADGYVRTLADTGKSEKFDNDGRLVRVSDKNGNFVAMDYGADGHLKRVVDNLNRKIFFTFNSHGLVTKIEGENSKVASYNYNGSDELVASKDVDGNSYAYKYDSQGRHNMVEVGYEDRSTLKVAYWGLDHKENVRQVIERDGTMIDYDYQLFPSERGHIAVSVSTRSGDEVLSKAKYEYFTKVKPNGEEWTHKLINEFDGDRTETTYNECCGLPLSIKQGKSETSFEYDVKGHVTKKTTPYEVTELHYDSVANKVDRVTQYSRKDKKKAIWSEFQYDPKGNLIFAKNSAGKRVKLIYDNLGRIRSLIDQNKSQINFKYNESSKPIEITDPSLGTITVSYTNSGEIKEINSQAGKQVALQVTAAFQGLLEIIKPAGVTLAF